MKPGLKRIEATLHHLKIEADSDEQQVAPQARTYSFEIYSAVQPSAVEEMGSQGMFSSPLSVQPFPAQQNHKIPTLPKIKSPSFSSHRNGANPALALGLLKEIQTEVAAWETELQQIVRQIQDIYIDGPIVDGWLESHSRDPEPGAAALRHAEVDRLMDYVEEICGSEQGITCESPRAGYRLCGLDPSGKMWSRPCPPEQLPSVSLAIARYQQLRQLLGRKQYLETRLGQLAETLVVLHSHLQS